MLPFVNADQSDSGALDNVMELLVRTGRDIPEVMMMLIPEAWQNDPLMDDDRRAFYQCAPASPASPAFVGLHACTLTREHCCECCRRCMRGTSCVLVLQVAASHRKLFTFTAHQSSVADTTPAGAVSVSVSAHSVAGAAWEQLHRPDTARWLFVMKQMSSF